MQSIRNNTFLTVTINIAHIIIEHNVFQCRKETKVRQLRQKYTSKIRQNFITEKYVKQTAVHSHASHPPWDVIRKPRAGYRGEAPTGPPRATLNSGIPQFFRLT